MTAGDLPDLPREFVTFVCPVTGKPYRVEKPTVRHMAAANAIDHQYRAAVLYFILCEDNDAAWHRVRTNAPELRQHVADVLAAIGATT